MNLTALDAAVQARGFSFVPPATGADDPTNPILIALNGAYRQVNGSQRWPWLEKAATLASTTAGSDTYTLSTLTDFRQLDAVRLTGADGVNHELTNMEPQEFFTATFESNSAPVRTAVPCYWTQYAGTVRLWPVPDGVYQIIVDYIYNPPDLAALTDIPVMPAVYHDVLVWGAIQELAFRERNIWAQELAMGYYAQRYKAMQDEYLLMQRQTASRVRKSGFFSSYDSGVFAWGAGN